jgi:hypothetical protein
VLHRNQPEESFDKLEPALKHALAVFRERRHERKRIVVLPPIIHGCGIDALEWASPGRQSVARPPLHPVSKTSRAGGRFRLIIRTFWDGRHAAVAVSKSCVSETERQGSARSCNLLRRICAATLQ